MEQKTKTEKEKYKEMREMFYKEIMRMAKMLIKQEEKMMKEIAENYPSQLDSSEVKGKREKEQSK